jgi:non-homologous end joining protein Ku
MKRLTAICAITGLLPGETAAADRIDPFAGLLPHCTLSASSLSEKVSFNRINRKTGNRLKQQNVDSETGEVVSRDDMVRGYEVAKGQYMIVEDVEIEAVQIESTRTIDIDALR